MYAMPPWWMPNSPNNETMNAKDFMEFIKAWSEFQASQKPKDEKKDDKKNPDEWKTGDYILWVFVVFNSTIILLTCFGLHELTAFLEVAKH